MISLADSVPPAVSLLKMRQLSCSLALSTGRGEQCSTLECRFPTNLPSGSSKESTLAQDSGPEGPTYHLLILKMLLRSNFDPTTSWHRRPLRWPQWKSHACCPSAFRQALLTRVFGDVALASLQGANLTSSQSHKQGHEEDLPLCTWWYPHLPDTVPLYTEVWRIDIGAPAFDLFTGYCVSFICLLPTIHQDWGRELSSFFPPLPLTKISPI